MPRPMPTAGAGDQRPLALEPEVDHGATGRAAPAQGRQRNSRAPGSRAPVTTLSDLSATRDHHETVGRASTPGRIRTMTDETPATPKGEPSPATRRRHHPSCRRPKPVAPTRRAADVAAASPPRTRRRGAGRRPTPPRPHPVAPAAAAAAPRPRRGRTGRAPRRHLHPEVGRLVAAAIIAGSCSAGHRVRHRRTRRRTPASPAPNFPGNGNFPGTGNQNGNGNGNGTQIGNGGPRSRATATSNRTGTATATATATGTRTGTATAAADHVGRLPRGRHQDRRQRRRRDHRACRAAAPPTTPASRPVTCHQGRQHRHRRPPRPCGQAIRSHSSGDDRHRHLHAGRHVEHGQGHAGSASTSRALTQTPHRANRVSSPGHIGRLTPVREWDSAVEHLGDQGGDGRALGAGEGHVREQRVTLERLDDAHDAVVATDVQVVALARRRG